jgi:FkbM family methyltransferase
MNNIEKKIIFGDVELKLFDLESSETLIHLEREVSKGDEYRIKNIVLNDDDVIVDIGANVGMVSIYLAKKFPKAKIFAYEAHPHTYDNLLRNINLNGVTNINPFNLAVYSMDDEILDISLDVVNTGSSSCYKSISNSKIEKIRTISLDTIIKKNNISRIKYFKIDCEGAEFDILENSKLIHQIEIEDIGIEIHSFMKSKGKNISQLINLINKISKSNPKIKIHGN